MKEHHYDERSDHEIDEERDRDFNDTGDTRFISDNDISNLADCLVDSEDSLREGLSQIGIDPGTFSKADLKFVARKLKHLGVTFDRELSCWCRQ